MALISIPNNTTNLQYYILPATQTLAATVGTPVTAQISVLVESGANTAFESMYFEDNTGGRLDSTLIGTFNSESYSVNTYQIIIPAGITVQSIQALSSACDLLSCSNTAYVNIVESSTGVLQVQPSSFIMSTSNTSQTIVLNNTGNGPLTTLQIPSESGFAITNNTCNSGSLAAGTSCRYTLTYTPGAASGQIAEVIPYNNGITSTSTPVTISYTGTNQSTYAIISASPASVYLNAENESQTITFTNTGTAPESGSIQTPILQDPLTISTNCNSSSLAIGESCIYTLSYSSSVASAGSTTVKFTYNNGTTSQTINIGVNWAANTLPPTLTANVIASPTSEYLNESNLRQIITLTNTGAGDATSFTLPSLSGTPLSKSTTCSSSIPASESCTYTVSYRYSSSASNESLVFSYNNGITSKSTNVDVNWAVIPIPAGSLTIFYAGNNSWGYPGNLLNQAESMGAMGITTGIEGADFICQTEAESSGWHPNIPSGYSHHYKAMITDGINRIACTSPNCEIDEEAENVDWVLFPNKSYISESSHPIGITTNSAIFTFPTLVPFSDGTTYGHYPKLIQYESYFLYKHNSWTGMNKDYTTNTDKTCKQWTAPIAGDDNPYILGEAGIGSYAAILQVNYITRKPLDNTQLGDTWQLCLIGLASPIRTGGNETIITHGLICVEQD